MNLTNKLAAGLKFAAASLCEDMALVMEGEGIHRKSMHPGM